jgi:uncharacterized protein DUF3570
VQLRIALAIAALGGVAHADGVVNVRGAYYKERATRVEQPMIDAAFDTGSGRVDGHFLVDSITSASSATGFPSAAAFTELRYEAGLGYTHALPGHIKVGAQGRYSAESDYFSTFVGVLGEIALWDQTTTPRLLVGHSFDTINNRVAVNNGAIGTPLVEESLDTTLASVGVTQVFSPRIVGGLTYDLIVAKGYQANLYRRVRGGSEAVLERVPDLRVRHAIDASARYYFPTHTTAIAEYRFYVDDWGIVAHTPELRVVQELARGLDLRLRYRYYVQSKADFYKDVYMQSDLADSSVYVTEDEKLSAFTTHTIGGQVSVAARLLGVQGLFGKVVFDAEVERIFQDNTFGNAWSGQVGIAVPFEY